MAFVSTLGMVGTVGFCGSMVSDFDPTVARPVIVISSDR